MKLHVDPKEDLPLRLPGANALKELHDALREIANSDWNEASIEKAFGTVLARHEGMKMGKLAQPVRVSITGRAISPGIFETLAVLGQSKSVARIGKALERFES